ncbi:hypothetical protein PsW64_04110 [Pseudovibrio sp. W64]|uniref:Hint domain-containing protein n=1 Tax=Pseudovibrio sp. W64 TaxID=1735583 RepID=UPI0007AE6737|nr:Hint domain-containing protein [Pseudovibrio sp. W64]KZK78471.1 hypothetical protein PsW64_04110 [Pseudovibrio sp. W64]
MQDIDLQNLIKNLVKLGDTVDDTFLQAAAASLPNDFALTYATAGEASIFNLVGVEVGKLSVYETDGSISRFYSAGGTLGGPGLPVEYVGELGIVYLGDGDADAIIPGISVTVEGGVAVGAGVSTPGLGLFDHIGNVVRDFDKSDLRSVTEALRLLPEGTTLYTSSGLQVGGGIEASITVSADVFDIKLGGQVKTHPFESNAYTEMISYISETGHPASISWTFEDQNGSELTVTQEIQAVGRKSDGTWLLNLKTKIVDANGHSFSQAELKDYGFKKIARVFTDDSGGFIDVEPCFLAGTPILLANGTNKPIEEIAVGDEVQSYNSAGELVASRVSKVLRKQSKHILDVFGLMITPGHVTYCGDGQFKGQHVPIIDILRSDGALMKSDGSLVRAGTGCQVGSEGDALLWAVTGDRQADGNVAIKQNAQIRAGSRFILDDGRDVCLLDLIKAANGELTEGGYIKLDGSETPLPFHWIFSDNLPAPEDYMLQRSQVSLTEIYGAAEWESKPSALPVGDVPSERHIITRSAEDIARGKPNIPLRLRSKLN